MIKISKKNEVFLHIDADSVILSEISNHLSAIIPGFQHMPAFKRSKGKWDGSIKYFSPFKRELYFGHLGELAKWAKKKGYPLEIEKDLLDFNNLTVENLNQLLDEAELPSRFDRRDYQFDAAITGLNTKRLLIESPTGSGKSFLTYLMSLHILNDIEGKIAIIVPTTSLVEQFYSDLQDYGVDVEALCARIYDKYPDKYPDKKIYISTWQSMFKMETTYFHRFGAVFGDEAHNFKAASLKHIMENMLNAEYRIGLTATLPDEKKDKMLVEGLFGPVFEGETTNSLIDKGYLNEMLPIEVIVLKYPEAERKLMKGAKYQTEIEHILGHPKRNEFIIDLARGLEGNGLVLFSRIESHGKPLYNSMKESLDKSVFYVAGEVETKDREQIRKYVNANENCLIVASMGTFSTGVNVPSLDNLIISAPTKSPTKVPQMIGRVLRKSKRPTRIIDIVDNLEYGGKRNYSLNHALERIKIYASRELKYTIKVIEL